ncbi:PAS domain-containing protein [Limimaricola variabilis]|uniref:PAS domain-containing protein n=1 Tax=Limimaricola variabilis TaxID=1492771 RepID=A0ABR6HL85_9RHOB|nr:PAS-domain containing protein [Limimaricola variabilis]MBB3711303.1 PAS domain-containing protein [Limimaricola variabilis]
MTLTPLLPLLIVICVSTLAAAAIVTLLARLAPGGRSRPAPAELRSVFLFDGDCLIDATAPARRLLDRLEGPGTERDLLVSLLDHRFPGLARRLAALEGDGRRRIEARGGIGWLELEHWDGLLRLSLCPGGPSAPDQTSIDAIAFAALQDELETLRCIGEDAPQLIWKIDGEGRLSWANRAYLRLAEAQAKATQPAGDAGQGLNEGAEHGRGWPPDRLFEVGEFKPAGPEGESCRVSLSQPRRPARRWFEVTRLHRGTETVHFALDVTEIVEAEQARRKFVQTLTKTFAQLAIGLAIFDRDRKLVIFNPAFHDLTGLPIAFLNSRPQVQTVLDRLRDRSMLPEPKDYASWREQVAALEAQATRGTYCETWSLPGGQTYRVTGRPHPDGAVAFLFEDISAEISLTRHFRAEIDTARAVLDTLPEAIAVFSAGGTRLLHNEAYETLWGAPDPGLAETGITEEVARWQQGLAPSPAPGRLRDLVGGFGERSAGTERLRRADGRGLTCRHLPLPGGAMLIGFAEDAAEGPRITTAETGAPGQHDPEAPVRARGR